jgi:raffinose/stachyose/melibiose transport system substrate-binding protein
MHGNSRRKRMSRIFVNAVSTLVLAALLLAACGSTPEPESTIQTVEVEKEVEVVKTVEVEKPVEVTRVVEVEKVVTVAPVRLEKSAVEVWYPDEDVWQCIIDGAVAEFNAQSDMAEVEGVTKGSVMEAREAVQYALARGRGPDVITPFGPAHITELVEAGQLLALDTYAQQYGWEKQMAPWALEHGRVDGLLYSLPVGLKTFVLWYNKALFEENGWEPPTTMDELIALAEEIDAAGIIPFAGGTSECPQCLEWYFGEFVGHIAGPEKVYQALKGEISWTDPSFVRSIETWKEMMQKGYWMGSVDRFSKASFDEFSRAFATGEAAMNLEGTWFTRRIPEYFGEEHEDDWDWVPFPSETGEAIFSLDIGGTRSLDRDSEDPQAAAEWLTYEFSPEVQARIMMDCGVAPAPVRMEASMLDGLDPRIARLYGEFAQAQAENNYGYTVWTFWTPNSETYIWEKIQRVLTDRLTVEDFLEGLDKVYAKDLADGLRPPLPER